MKRFMIGCVALACAVSGCGGSKDAGPTVTSTMPTPSAGDAASSASMQPQSAAATPASTTARNSSLQASADKEFMDFEQRYLAWQIQGGSASLPADLAQYLAVPMATDVQQLLARQRLVGWRLSSRPAATIKLLGSAGVRPEGSNASVLACVDATSVPIIGDRNLKHGVAVKYRVFFKDTRAGMQMFMSQHQEVSKC